MINIPKGTKDVLPQDSYKWQYIEAKARETAALYNIIEIRTPVFEHTELFLRGVGETTDVVSKEMYTFLDKGNRSITLKPEGTAGVARAFVESNLAAGIQPVKMFYFTPVFRYEKPQAGRLREHHQFGVELFGCPNPETDAQVISLAHDFFSTIGIKDLELNINSIGCTDCRKEYNAALKTYFTAHINAMCVTCNDRLSKNPMRILDCKCPDCQAIAKDSPKILDFLCDGCQTHFKSLQNVLKAGGIAFKINPDIVRGLDYYTKTVFEFVSTSIGSQGTVCGGGRYDNLVELVGGKPAPAVGFGMGMERLLLLMENTGVNIPDNTALNVFVAAIGEAGFLKAGETVRLLRKNGISADYDTLFRSLKSQFKFADKLKSKFVIIIGENEISGNNYNIKNMTDGSQHNVTADKLISFFADVLKNPI